MDDQIVLYNTIINHQIELPFKIPNFLIKTSEYLILQPLALLYFHGPNIYGYGFWAGKSNQEICSLLTEVDSNFWINNIDACIQLISKKFTSFAIFIFIIFYFFIVYKFLLYIVNKFVK